MTNDWIIDVLMDLKKFSVKNELEHLAEHLEDTISIASRELGPPVRHRTPTAGELEQARGHAGGAVSGNNA